MRKLQIQCGSHRDEFVLPEGSTIIGGAASCRLRIPSPGLQPLHVKCYHDGRGKVILTRLSERGLVEINGRSVPPEQPQMVLPGDRISLGEVVLVLVGDALEPAAPPVPVSPAPESGETGARGISFDEAPDYAPGNASAVQQLSERSSTRSLSQGGRPVDLLQHDGRWFLRDRETHREVEITPVEAEARRAGVYRGEAGGVTDVEAAPIAAAPGASPGQVRRRVLAAVALAAFAGVLVLWRPWGQPAVTPQAVLSDFEGHIRLGFSLLLAEDFSGARYQFETARRVLPDDRLSSIALDAVHLEANRGEQFERYRWDVAEHLYRELERNPRAAPEVREFARKRTGFVTTHRVQEATWRSARQLLEQGLVREACAKARSIPADSIVHRQQKAWFEALPRAAARVLAQEAEEARRAQQWTRAIEVAREALQLDEACAEARQTEAESAAAQNAQQCLAEARALLTPAGPEKADQTARRLEKALSVSQGSGVRPLFAGTPFESEGLDLVKEIHQRLNSLQAEQRAQVIERLFHEGNGRDALKMLAEAAGSLPASTVGLEAQIERAVKLHEEAAGCEQVKDYGGAKRAWAGLKDAVPDADNAYHRLAQRSLERYERDAGTISDEFRRWATQILETSPAKARDMLRQSLQWDPGNRESARTLLEMDKQANQHFQLGYTNRTRDRAKAREHFERAVQFAEEGSEVSLKAAEELKKFGGQ
ncbi:MAG: hypothetical protein HYU36_25205 [Planctomycetes bacterium]|nr:hypothetical protein [Planctomycetota bacterium]